MELNLDELAEFLVKAKKSTYASDMPPIIADDGSNNLEYHEGLYVYRDRYFGNNPFGGQEVVLLDRNPIWVMNYHGSMLNLESLFQKQMQREFLTEATYTFLRQALSHVMKDKPFRGLDRLESSMFVYLCESEGDLVLFNGTERIHYKLADNRLVYQLRFHGGMVRKSS